jgi:hypothetical protein
VLFVLLAAEGVTILKVGRLLTLHFFIGMLLLGPVTLKAASVMYRFCRYYTGSVPYRRKGPPLPLMRILGPFVVLSTAGVFGTGIALAVVGPGKGPWMFLHKATFALWFCVLTVHVLVYMPRLIPLIGAEFRRPARQHSGSHSPSHAAPRSAFEPGPRSAFEPGTRSAFEPGPPSVFEPGPPSVFEPGPRPAFEPASRSARHAASYSPAHSGSHAARPIVSRLGGRGLRISLLIASLAGGLVIALMTVHLAAPWHFAHIGH